MRREPFATFFGDEEFFKSRPIWMRNLGLGVPISAADLIYAFDETGKSGYLFVLAPLQALVGDAPYGVHVFNARSISAASLVLYRLVRPSVRRLVGAGRRCRAAVPAEPVRLVDLGAEGADLHARSRRSSC